jgi:CRP-like cAMP-binding protein
VVGEVAFLDGAPRSAELVAETEGELRRLSLESFESLAARHPELGRAILFDLGRITATRLRWLTDRVARAD